jgi:hypothetical protein
MYIADYSHPSISPTLHYAEQTHALIVKTNTELGKDNVLGVYIPKLMFGLPIKNGAYENTISIGTDKILNSKNKKIGSTTLKTKNYVVLPVSINPNINMPKYVNGENVIVDFADKDIKSAYILPYSFGDTNRRKTDIITLFVNNFSEEGESPDTHNIYALQLDTKNQVASIFTSDTNGEKGVYTFAINGNDGSILISDSGKRKIQIKTDDDSITMINEAKSEITMKDTVIDMKADILNIDMRSEINMKTNKITREANSIESTAMEDTENIVSLVLKGNTYDMEYNTQTLKGTSHENTTCVFKVIAPIAGFSEMLTTKNFCMFLSPGLFPTPVSPSINTLGVAMFGTPSLASLPLASAPQTIAALTLISAIVDGLCALHCIPPFLSDAMSSMGQNIPSKWVMG